MLPEKWYPALVLEKMAGRYKTHRVERIYSDENCLNVLPTEGSGQQLSVVIPDTELLQPD